MPVTLAQIELISDTQYLVAHVAIDNDAGKSFVRGARPYIDGQRYDNFVSRPYWRYIPAESDFTTLEDRLALSEIEMVGSTTQLTLFGYQTGVQELWAVKQNSGDLFSEASFSNFEILALQPRQRSWSQPKAVALSNGSFLVATTDLVKREVVLLEVGSDAALILQRYLMTA